MYLACHAPIMDNPENNQHFSVLILVGGLRISTLCTIEKMLTIVNDPLVSSSLSKIHRFDLFHFTLYNFHQIATKGASGDFVNVSSPNWPHICMVTNYG